MNIEFLRFATIQEVYENYILKIEPINRIEVIKTVNAPGHVCTRDIISPENLPGFDKSLVDGYAIRSSDTKGASMNLPVLLKVAFEIRIGEIPKDTLKPGEAAWIPTGGALPKGADAVVMVEHTQTFDDLIEVMKPVAAGENVIRHDEDVKIGEVILKKNKRIRINDVQLLLQLGITQIDVYQRAKIAVISTGDEIIEPWEIPSFAQVRDSNTYTLVSWLKTLGFISERIGHVRDDEDNLYNMLRDCFDDYDVIVIAGGSSIGTRDHTAKAIERLGKPGVIYHGVMVQPGKPTILALVGQKPVLGLPGNPVSFFVSSRFFLLPVLRKIEGEEEFTPKPVGLVKLTKNVPSIQGREHFVRVKLKFENGSISAEPIFSETAHVSNISIADGVVRVPSQVEGIYAGQLAEFYTF
ncbi:MAG TPA: gephyrin-like molybdotransferase Glp [Pseudothermotoga sp.]